MRYATLFFCSILGASLALACSASTVDGVMPTSGLDASQSEAAHKPEPDDEDGDGDGDGDGDALHDDSDDAGQPRRRDAGRLAEAGATHDGGSRPDAGSRPDGGSRSDGGARADAGRKDSGGGVGAHCATLSGCCSSLPSAWQGACTNAVNFNIESECQRLYGVYQGDGYCGGGPQGACTSLDACCQQVPSGYYATCQYYVTANSQTDCATIHSNYKSSGWCN